MSTFESSVHGIPCQIEITHFYGGWRGSYWEPPEYPEAEIRILDRRGRHAPWLERKLSEAEWREKEGEAIEWVSKQERDDEPW